MGVKRCVRPDGRPDWRHAALSATCAAALLCLVQPAAAAYPDRPVTLDRAVRARAGRPTSSRASWPTSLSQTLGQQFVVDNRAAPPATPAWGRWRARRPDGYTLLVTSTAIAVNPALFKKLPYDPIKDFAPISELVNAPNVLVVRANSGIKSDRRPDRAGEGDRAKFSYASPGAGTKSHLTGELLKLRADIDMVHVPYRGAGPAAQAVLEKTDPGRLGGAGGRRSPDPERTVARARGHQREALVLAAERADHDRGRLQGFVSDTFNAFLAPARRAAADPRDCW